MRYWRIQVAAFALRRIHILSHTNQTQIAVCDLRERVRCYGFNDGALYSDVALELDILDHDLPSARQAGLERLKADNGVYFPFVELNGSHLYTSDDGSQRLIHDLNAGLTLEDGRGSYPLDLGDQKVVVKAGLDRAGGRGAAVTPNSRLHLFQGTQPVRSILLDAPVEALYMAGDTLIVIEAEHIKRFDQHGTLFYKQPLHYRSGPTALSPNGKWLLVADMEYQLLRLYNANLELIRQQHAVDLMNRARPLQMFITEPSFLTPIAALDINNEGQISFAMGGILCTAHIEMMTRLPR